MCNIHDLMSPIYIRWRSTERKRRQNAAPDRWETPALSVALHSLLRLWQCHSCLKWPQLPPSAWEKLRHRHLSLMIIGFHLPSDTLWLCNLYSRCYRTSYLRKSPFQCFVPCFCSFMKSDTVLSWRFRLLWLLFPITPPHRDADTLRQRQQDIDNDVPTREPTESVRPEMRKKGIYYSSFRIMTNTFGIGWIPIKRL